MNQTRSKASQNKYGPAESTDLTFNQQSSGFKMLGPILGNLTVLGALNAAVPVNLGSLVAIYNNSAVTAWAAMGTTSGVAAPTGGANGIALAPMAYTILAMYNNNFIICSAATCFGYLVNDDVNMSPSAGSNS